MKCLTNIECQAWVESNGSALKEQTERLVVNIPKTSREQAHLVQFIIELSGDFDGGLFWAKGWKIWPSEENFCLVERFRISYGEERLLIESPGHLFEANERAEMEGLCRLGVLFGWDFLLFFVGSDVRVFSSHDEYLEISSKNKAILSETRSFLENI